MSKPEDSWRTKDLVQGAPVAILTGGSVARAYVGSVSKKYITVKGLKYHRDSGICREEYPYVLADPDGFEARRRFNAEARRVAFANLAAAFEALSRAPRSAESAKILRTALDTYEAILAEE
jgi:hypothetical protein